jgi:hypothetical protein
VRWPPVTVASLLNPLPVMVTAVVELRAALDGLIEAMLGPVVIVRHPVQVTTLPLPVASLTEYVPVAAVAGTVVLIVTLVELVTVTVAVRPVPGPPGKDAVMGPVNPVPVATIGAALAPWPRVPGEIPENVAGSWTLTQPVQVMPPPGWLTVTFTDPSAAEAEADIFAAIDDPSGAMTTELKVTPGLELVSVAPAWKPPPARVTARFATPRAIGFGLTAVNDSASRVNDWLVVGNPEVVALIVKV